MNTNMIIAIATVLAVIVSSISTIIAAISVKKHTKYNKDNVRPICSIYLTNYNNLISVRIENDGIGPAIINNIECVYAKDIKKETLYELLPENLKHEVFHSVITKKAKNLTITANEKFYLISITPKDDKVLQEFRDFLKK